MSRAIQFKLSGRQKPISIEGYRKAARSALPNMVWTYVDHGSDSMVTMQDSVDAYSRWALRLKVLVGPNPREKSVTLHDTQFKMPVAIAPTGLNGLSHWQGDVAMAKGAEAAGTRLVLSGGGSHSVEEVAEATAENHWFQLYPWGDRNLTGSLMKRAQEAGYPVLVVTVDVQVVGNREGERLQGMGIPPVLTPRRVIDGALHPRWAYGFLKHQRVSVRNLTDDAGIGAAARSAEEFRRQVSMENLGWEDLEWMRDQWPGPLYVKGILDPSDAERAVALGADGIVVSNHGGRQLDHCLATVDALPGIVAAVGDRATVILDGGIRRGSDVIKALCLGADLCLVGRPAVYGLAADGQDGVSAVLQIFHDEIDRTMLLMGAKSIAELDQSWLIRAGGSPLNTEPGVPLLAS